MIGLPRDELWSCLLYSYLYPEDYKILNGELKDYWISEGFMSACLTEEEDDHLKIQGMIREMALWIACTIEKEVENLLVRTGVQLTKPPTIEEWKGVKRVSLMAHKIKSLSEIPSYILVSKLCSSMKIR